MVFGPKISQVMLCDNPDSTSKSFSPAGPVYTYGKSQPFMINPKILQNKTNNKIIDNCHFFLMISLIVTKFYLKVSDNYQQILPSILW